MPSKKRLLDKLYSSKFPKSFTTHELDQLMGKCNCISSSGGRGSAVKYYHKETGRVLQFDQPHPGNNLYVYQVKMVRDFIDEIGEHDEEDT